MERGSALEALVDAASGILAADSLDGTLGRIAHHLCQLLHYTDLTVYEVDDANALLRPVFAVGQWVDEVLSNPIPLGTGVTGWVVANRQTRNVPNTCWTRSRTWSPARRTIPRPSYACRCRRATAWWVR